MPCLFSLAIEKPTQGDPPAAKIDFNDLKPEALEKLNEQTTFSQMAKAEPTAPFESGI